MSHISAIEADQTHACGQERKFNLIQAEAAYASFLDACGVDLKREDLRDTPKRAAKAMHEFLSPQPFDFTTFENTHPNNYPVILSGVRFNTLCEHHILPFYGTAVVAYLPGERLVGLSKLARVVQYAARRLQVQERMTSEIASLLEKELAPKGVGVVVDAEHTCMSLRGVKSMGSTTRTAVLKGAFDTDESLRRELFDAAQSSKT